ncbi:LytTR family DNA-binding domain-containing protein [Parapedobacter koreensis]|uniref:Transcriptional regulator, LytTR family n=1 Tax=Parapedobacter koreensis TaxID=332977 RepID=A0A1H7TVJ2_9SPHI|nr:LytTR family DNA-binding domain-containing protein [Parapedobacter koreensis]SEL88575.1 transcriptional regulator, LytTR family [Parapedobacter koreensis]
MKKIMDFIRTPYPAYIDPWSYLRTITIISLVIFFILYMFRPFDWWRMSEDRLLFAAAISSVATFAAMLLFYVWRYLFPTFFAERNWTLGKEMLLGIHQFTVVALAVWLVRLYFEQYYGDAPRRSFFFTWWVVFTTGTIPYLLATLLKRIYGMRLHLAEAMVLNRRLPKEIEKDEPSVFSLPKDMGIVEDFLFAESRDNYVDVYGMEGGVVKSRSIRCTLLELEACNPASAVFRCHRAFIVDLRKVLHVTGNAAGFQISVHPDLPPIPVSRSYAAAFKARMGNAIQLA